MSPAIVYTDDPDATATLADAMARAEQRWPRGELSAAEHASLRTREALARVTGRVATGPGYSVHALPASHARPASLPRSVQLVHVADLAAAVAHLAPWRAHLSRFGAPADLPVPLAEAERVALGELQRPALVRPHDGVDWLRLTLA